MRLAILTLSALLACSGVVRAQNVPADAQAASTAQPEAPGFTEGVGPADHSQNYGPWPAPDANYITDTQNVLNRQQQDELEQYLWYIEEHKGVEIAVLIIDSIQDYPGTSNRSIETFARGLFDTWGIGNLPANDGVLLVVALGDRKARIELGNGYGNLRDSDAQYIMDHAIIPQFKKGDYANGVIAGTKALGLEFAGVRLGFNWGMLYSGLGSVIATLIAVSLFRSGKRGWGWVAVGGAIVMLLYFLNGLRTAHRINSEWGGGGSSGGFGGGFGGGFSGGGGASGGW